MPNQPLVVAITGSLGSGKNMVGTLLAQRGVTVIDADQIAREVTAAGSPVLSEIRTQFGDGVFDLSKGELNRKALGAVIFSDAKKRKLLEQILHPQIRARFLEKLDELRRHPRPAPWIIAYLVPLLFESGFDYSEIKKTVVVSAPDNVCIDRVMARDNCSREAAEARLKTQLPTGEKEKRANYVVQNSGSIAELEQSVKVLYEKLAANAAS